MRRKLCLLIVLGFICLSGALVPAAQAASCTPHCFMPDCGDECCTFSNCLTHCVHVICSA
jgi:hypothetical protein